MKNIEVIKDPKWLRAIDQEFISSLTLVQQQMLLDYRNHYDSFNQGKISRLILELAPLLEVFLADKFEIKKQVEASVLSRLAHKPVMVFKKLMVQKASKKNKPDKFSESHFQGLNTWLFSYVCGSSDLELAVADLFVSWQNEGELDSLEKLSFWCWYCLYADFASWQVKSWSSFNLPAKVDFNNLVAAESVDNNRLQASESNFRQRQGFSLTDEGMSQREVQSQADYCIFCHKNQGDFCSRGFPVKKSQPELGLKKSSLGEVLTGCPLEEKISEMQFLANDGHSIAALAVVMIDNPLCPATGHRVCNDCMKACIYQKQTPVDIPQIETSVLNSVLGFSWGVEIYDLLLNWNPLRAKNYLLAEPNDYKVMVMGMGPAGFTAANQLLMLGYTVVGADGLKIEPVAAASYQAAVKNFTEISSDLNIRSVLGFGGVAEYGITVRWNKNYLSLILLVLLRRRQFKVFGGVRFGGAITVKDVWRLGFDHLVLAVGAGLPRELKIPGSLSLGVRAANDFLMALQLSGAHKFESLTSLEVDLPAVVIGGGLTGIDAATELQAYYLLQIEKASKRYTELVKGFGEKALRARFSSQQLVRLDRWRSHAKELQVEKEKCQPNLIKLLHSWGGVTVVYRKHMQDSPAYKRNHEELLKALEEGLLYLPCFAPVAIVCDEHGYCQSLTMVKMLAGDDGEWQVSGEQASLPARTVLVATGAQPNVAYGFEHADDFVRKRYQYTAYSWQQNKLVVAPVAEHCKADNIGVFTSYNEQNKCVSFIGDTHPVFHGSVVKAIASAMYAVPLINAKITQYAAQSGRGDFLDFCDDYFQARVIDKVVLLNKQVLLTIKASSIVEKHMDGHFVRLQAFESLSSVEFGYSLHGEAVSAPIFAVDKINKTFKVLLLNRLVSEKLLANVSVGSFISAMGPTGVRAKVLTDAATVLLLVDQDLIAHACAIINALHSQGHFVIVLLQLNAVIDDHLRCCLEKYAGLIIWEAEFDMSSRSQDLVVGPGSAWRELLNYLANNMSVASKLIDVRLMVDAEKVAEIKEKLADLTKVSGAALSYCSVAVYGPMQCMLKGVCAQCLQWQIDPISGERTKAVYACSWQDQPLDLVDLNHLTLRHNPNKVLEKLNSLILCKLKLDSK